MFIGVFVINPNTNPMPNAYFWHSVCFLQLIPAICFNKAGTLLERRNTMTRSHFIFYVVFVVWTIVYVTYLLVSYYVYWAEGRTGVDPLLPWWVGVILDYGWLLLLLRSNSVRVLESRTNDRRGQATRLTR